MYVNKMSAIHVKSGEKWQDVSVNPQIFGNNDMSDFISLKELTGYEIVARGSKKKKAKVGVYIKISFIAHPMELYGMGHFS